MNSQQMYQRAARLLLLSLLFLALQRPQCYALEASSFTSTVYFHRQSNGSILALSSVDSSVTELERSTEYARFVGMTLHQRTGVLYWSDGRSIKWRSATATDAQIQVLIGTLAHVTWYGVNFGSSQSDIVELGVKGTACVSVLSWSPEKVECLVGLPLRYPSTAGDSVSLNEFVKAEDCRIQTTSGAMQGFAPNYGEMRASGYPSPIVEHLDVRATFISPHAFAVNDNAATVTDKTEEWLYWSNSADGKIYRSHLGSTHIEVVQENVWGVRGLAIGRLSSSEETTSSLYFSLASKGVIARIPLPSSPIAGALPKREVLLQGLESPRGIALDAMNQALYFAEKTGRIFRAKMLRDGVVSTAMKGDNDNKSGPKMVAHKVVALATMTRLDGLAVDSKFLYWCESNSNVVARASLTSFMREVLVGGTPNSHLSWPRSIVLRSLDGAANSDNDDFFYSEYTGRIAKGRASALLIDELTASTMVYLDQLVQRSSIAKRSGDDNTLHLYALE